MEYIMAVLVFLLISLLCLPVDKLFPNRKLHKLLIILKGMQLQSPDAGKKGLWQKLLIIGENLYKHLNLKQRNKEYTDYQNRLTMADFNYKVTVEAFLGLKILLVLVFFLYFFLYFLCNINLKATLLLLIGPIMAYYVPDNLLKKKIRERQWQLQTELPSILNTLAIMTDAGLGLYEAVKKVCEIREGVLVRELKKVMEDINMGFLQRDAFNRMADRCQVNEISVFVFTLNQSLEKGVAGVARSLKEQAQEVWEARKNRAKELGEKASIKLFFPMLLFVFPCLLIFILGPVVFSVLQLFVK